MSLRDTLQSPDPRGREIEIAMVIHLQPFIAMHQLTPNETARALIGSVANLLLAAGQSHDDARTGAALLAGELRRRVGEVSRR